MTKCNENQSKEETKNKAPKIINTGKYMINQPVNITYQEAQRRVIIGKYTKKQTCKHYLSGGSTKDNYKVCYYTQ